MKHPFRFWMTGCVAVVSMALGGSRAAWADDRDDAEGRSGRGQWQTSRFDVSETMRRLEASARVHGLGVFARWAPTAGGAEHGAPRAPSSGAARREDLREGAVLVFESVQGGTPVLMHGGSAAPDLPLSLCVRSRADGRAEVRLPPAAAAYGDELPADVALELTGLPALVADALGQGTGPGLRPSAGLATPPPARRWPPARSG